MGRGGKGGERKCGESEVVGWDGHGSGIPLNSRLMWACVGRSERNGNSDHMATIGCGSALCDGSDGDSRQPMTGLRGAAWHCAGRSGGLCMGGAWGCARGAAWGRTGVRHAAALERSMRLRWSEACGCAGAQRHSTRIHVQSCTCMPHIGGGATPQTSCRGRDMGGGALARDPTPLLMSVASVVFPISRRIQSKKTREVDFANHKENQRHQRNHTHPAPSTATAQHPTPQPPAMMMAQSQSGGGRTRRWARRQPPRASLHPLKATKGPKHWSGGTIAKGRIQRDLPTPSAFCSVPGPHRRCHSSSAHATVHTPVPPSPTIPTSQALA